MDYLIIIFGLFISVGVGILLGLIVAKYRAGMIDEGNLLKWVFLIISVALFFDEHYIIAVCPLVAAFLNISND